MSTKLDFEEGEFNGQKVQLLDMKPAAHAQVDEPPIYLEPGWAARMELFDEYIHKLKESGRRVVGANEPHGVDIEDERLAEYAEVERRKATAIHNVLQGKRISIANVVAHSQGALTTTAAAETFPNQFRNLVLVNPVGLIGKDSTPKLIARFGYDGLIQLKQLLRDPKQWWRINYLSSNTTASDIPRTWREVHTLAGADITDRLRSVRENLNGIKVIHTTGDRALPIARVREQIGKIDPTILREEPGTHNEIMFRQGDFADMTIETLKELESE